MSAKKKEMRRKFGESVFKRDRYCCVFCKDRTRLLDAHHITDRNEMPNGGYVLENGITLCAPCHVLAEIFHSTGVAHLRYAPEDLYRYIDSSYEKAVEASKRL